MIRKATEEDLSRIAEIFVFNNRINYFPIFKQEEYSFGELQVVSMIDHYFGKGEVLENLYVADECGIVKGFMEIHGTEIRKLYVDPCFQSGGIGKKLIEHAISTFDVDHLWALEKNTRAIAFYHRHGFGENVEQNPDDGYLAEMRREAVARRKSEQLRNGFVTHEIRADRFLDFLDRSHRTTKSISIPINPIPP